MNIGQPVEILLVEDNPDDVVLTLHALRARRPARLVCAVPVASYEALELVRPHADEVVCLDVPVDFRAVGQFYLDFRQVGDDEVVALLREAGAKRAAPPRPASGPGA